MLLLLLGKQFEFRFKRVRVPRDNLFDRLLPFGIRDNIVAALVAAAGLVAENALLEANAVQFQATRLPARARVHSRSWGRLLFVVVLVVA